MSQGRRIAIVDDSAADASVMELAMRRTLPQSEVTWFPSATKAMEQLGRGCPFDLVICDVRLGGEDGYDLLNGVAGSPDCTELPVVMTSSYLSPEEIQQCYDLGAKWYFEKPFTLARATAITDELASRWLKIEAEVAS